MTERSDKRFDEIVLKDIKVKIAEAFLDLEACIRVREYTTTPIGDYDEALIKRKANQMKTELTTFIDSQAIRITGFLKNQAQTENQEIE